MISPSDEDYLDTKRIKKGERKLPPLFTKLVQWLEESYRTSILNIRLEHTKLENRPRLNIIVEYEQQMEPFREDIINYKKEAVADITQAFKRICRPDEDVSDLFIIFSSFARVARAEANSAITKAEIDALKQQLNLDELWEISRSFGSAYFMLYTDRQVEEFEKNGMKEELSQAYFELLKPHDEFDYFDKEIFSIFLGSKEDFDKNYDSNWYFYYK